MRIRIGFVTTLLIGLQATGAYCLPLEWNNTGTGPTAGDWFVATNWNLAIVPTSLDNVQISNGGEAKTDILTAVGNIVANRIEVGKNDGIGTFTDTGVAVNIGVDLDIGEIGGGFAAGPIVVNSNGTATISDASSVQIGTTGAGDLDIGQTSASLGAQAFGTGALTIERVPLVTVQDNAEIGLTSGTAQATGDGSLTLNDVDNFSVGGNLSVGETGSTIGTKNAQGTVDFDLVDILTVNDNFSVGRSFNAGGQDTSNGIATLDNSGTIFVSNNLEAGAASVSGGGTADATGSITIQTATSLTVDNLIGIGHVRGTAVSGQVDALGDASILDVNTISITRDLFVGRIFTSGDVFGTADGTLTIERASSVTIGADFDVAQAGTSGVSVGGLGNAMGTGNATIRDITGTVGIADDLDVGQTSSVANSTAQGNGTLLLERLGALEVGIDFDVGQAGGAGQATGTGFVTIVDTPSIIIGEDFDIGRTSGSATSVNDGNGTVSISDSTVSLGFANALLPGSLNVGDASVVGNEQASAFGRATFERVSLTVADRINVGGLAGGSTNPLTATDGIVTFKASLVSAPIVDVAVIPDGSAGTAVGQLYLNPSLLDVNGPLTLGNGATLTFDLAGTTRADGTGAAGQYGAIDTNSVAIDGVLEILLADGFMPSSGDFFDLLSTTGTIAGSFDSTVFPTLSPNLSWNFVQTANLLRLEVQDSLFDGDFDGDLDVDGNDFLAWQRGFGITSGASKTQGDADLGGEVDGIDLSIWEATYGTFVSPSTAALSTPVPEPNSTVLVVLLGMSLVGFTGLRRRVCCRHLCVRVAEQ